MARDKTPSHDASRNSAAAEDQTQQVNNEQAVEQINATAQAGGIRRARVRISELADKLAVEYIKPQELAALGPFNIIDAHVRGKRGEFGVQCEYECQLLTGEQAGASAFLTLNESPTRRKLVDMVEQYGSVGPVVLRPVGKEIRGNQPWGFVEPGTPEAEGVAAAATA